MFLKKDGKGYYRLYEWIDGKAKYISYIGKDPSTYYASLEKGNEILGAIKRYPDLAIKGSGQAILAEHKRRILEKPEIPEGEYKTIVIDPPWPVEKIVRKVVPINQQYDFDYATMTIEDIKQLPVNYLSNKKGCHIYLWTTQKYLPESFNILKSWDVDYIFTMIWHKNGGFQPFNLPQYNSEFILFGRMGALPFLTTKRFPTCFNGGRREHSRKPIEFDDIVRRVSPEPRLDYFSREEKDGFIPYGTKQF